jgi:EAL domain-containing protein (putative c-di-GMP-specific phosphodiesterase class I)
MESATLPGAICTCAQGVPIDLKFAFQPIVDTRDRSVFAQEALVRGPQGQGAGEILARVRDINIHAFDRTCRVGAVKTAVRIFGHRTELLSLNMMPNAVYDPETCLRTTVAAAETAGFAASRLMFEMTEHEAIRDLDHFKTIVAFYKRMGFITAIDDFGAGSSGLTLFASIRPDIVKLDRKLVAGIDRADIQKAIVGNLVDLCAKLDIGIVAEGVEEAAEVAVLQDLGVNFFQGYFFARPAFEAIVPDADIVWA